MKKLLLIIFSILLYKALYSQTIQWEKTYNLYKDDMANSICPIPQSTDYMVLGATFKYGGLSGNIGYYGSCLIKLNALGDTVWVKDLNIATNLSVTGNSMYAVSDGYWLCIQGNYFDTDIHLVKINFEGLVQAHYTVSGWPNALQPYYVRAVPNGDVLTVGQTAVSSYSGMAWDCFVTRMSSTGTVKWTRYYNLGYYTEAYYVEGMANGHYWVSGSAYSDIWGMELDTSGNVVRQHIFYSTPTNAKIDKSYVQQLPNQKYLVIGAQIRTAPDGHYYLGMYDSNYTKEWGHEEVGGIHDRGYITSENKIVLGGGVKINNQWSTALRKYNSDSSLVWNVTTSGSSISGYKFFNSIAFTGDGDAVFAGYIDSPYPTVYDLYFMKVGGIGLPYLPETDSSWLLTSSKPIIKSSSKVSVYPNPASESVKVSCAVGSIIELLSVTGQLLHRQEATTESVDLSLTAFRTGIYVLKVNGVSHQLSVSH